MGHGRRRFDGGYFDTQKGLENLESEVMSQSLGPDAMLQWGPWAPFGELRALGMWHQKGVKTGVLRKGENIPVSSTPKTKDILATS